MKRFAMRALIVAAAVIALAAPAAQAQVAVSVTIGGFYDELVPYGRWIDCSYGQCWVPARVAADWQPYSNGQWIYTEYGWTWVSADPWGGNPYHYGTWTSIAGYGWAWVPGTVWAPAWVTWNYSNSYVGWAPVPPTIAFGMNGYAGAPIVVSQTQYVFVPTNRFVGVNVRTVRVPVQQSPEIYRQTRPVTGFAVSGGIVRNTALPMETIERASRGKIETRSIQSAGTAPRAVSAGTGQLAVVAPAREVKAAVAARPQAAPRSTDSSREGKKTSAQPVVREADNAKAPKAAAAPAGKPGRQTAQSPAERPEASRQAEASRPASKPAPPSHADKDKPAEKSNRQTAQPPAGDRSEPRQAEASRPASKPTPQAAREKPSEKNKKPDGERP